jgi:hypothetical protein
MSRDLHDTAVSLAKEADARREELTRARCIPSDIFKRAADGGLFRQMVARQLGGLGVSPVEWFENGMHMARWEPSLPGWSRKASVIWPPISQQVRRSWR